MNVCKLRNLGIVDNSGNLVGYNLDATQNMVLLKKLMSVLKGFNVGQDIIDYTSKSMLPYPECIIVNIIHKHKDDITKLLCC